MTDPQRVAVEGPATMSGAATALSAATPLRIVCDDNMPAVEACCRSLLSQPFEIRRYPGRTMTAEQVQEADLLLVRSITRVNAELLAGSQVRFVGTATIGTDHLDADWLKEHGIAWASAPGCNARAVGEWVLNVLIQLAAEQGVALAGRRLGIVGLGHVGSCLARLARIMGMEVVASDPFLSKDSLPADLTDLPLLALPDLLAQCDMVSVHTPLTRSGAHPTFHLLDAAVLACLRPGSWLINAGRGEVVAQDDLLPLLPALTVVLDVWEGEPVVNAELLAGVRWGSPHIAGHSLEGKWRGSWQIVQSAAGFMADGVAPLTGLLSDILPDTGCQELHLEPAPAQREAAAAESRPALTLEQRLAPLLRKVIALDEDDQRLRQAQQEERPTEAFDRLRKQYAIRREFPAHVVHVASGDELAPILAALGFVCRSTET